MNLAYESAMDRIREATSHPRFEYRCPLCYSYKIEDYAGQTNLLRKMQCKDCGVLFGVITTQTVRGVFRL